MIADGEDGDVQTPPPPPLPPLHSQDILQDSLKSVKSAGNETK